MAISPAPTILWTGLSGDPAIPAFSSPVPVLLTESPSGVAPSLIHVLPLQAADILVELQFPLGRSTCRQHRPAPGRRTSVPCAGIVTRGHRFRPPHLVPGLFQQLQSRPYWTSCLDDRTQQLGVRSQDPAVAVFVDPGRQAVNRPAVRMPDVGAASEGRAGAFSAERQGSRRDPGPGRDGNQQCPRSRH